MNNKDTHQCPHCAEAHSVLDEDASKIIRNAKDGYPEGREPHELTLAERVKSLCRYAADWKRWFESEAEKLSHTTDVLPVDLCTALQYADSPPQSIDANSREALTILAAWYRAKDDDCSRLLRASMEAEAELRVLRQNEEILSDQAASQTYRTSNPPTEPQQPCTE